MLPTNNDKQCHQHTLNTISQPAACFMSSQQYSSHMFPHINHLSQQPRQRTVVDDMNRDPLLPSVRSFIVTTHSLHHLRQAADTRCLYSHRHNISVHFQKNISYRESNFKLYKIAVFLSDTNYI